MHHLGHTAYHHIGAASDSDAPDETPAPQAGDLLRKGAVAFAAYHGWQRSGSVVMAIVWGVAASWSPAITTGIAAAQHFGLGKGGR